MSKGDKDEKLSPTEYLSVIRPNLRDLINKHKPVEELIIIIIIITTIIIIITLSVENGKLCYECILNVFLLKVLIKHALCTQKVNK